MANNNLFVSYRAHAPEQDITQLIRAMNSVGTCMQVQEFFWYINSSLNVSKAKEVLLENIDPKDTLIVIDASNNEFDMNRCLREQAESRLRRIWR
jgi:hypothetical protein